MVRLIWSTPRPDPRPDEAFAAGGGDVWHMVRPGFAGEQAPCGRIVVPAWAIPRLDAVLGVDSGGCPFFPGAGSWGDLKKYDPASDRVSDYFEPGPPAWPAWHLGGTPLREGAVAPALGEEAIALVDGERVVVRRLAPPYPWRLEAATRDSSGRIWAVASDGVVVFAPDGTLLFEGGESFRPWDHAIGVDAVGRLWLGGNKGVACYRLEAITPGRSGLEPVIEGFLGLTGLEPGLGTSADDSEPRP